MASETLYYDGDCGLCHRSVRFLAALDREGEAFRFAPLGGETFRRNVPAEVAAELPDSLVLQRADGTLLLRTDATVHALRRIGGVWSALGTLLSWVPKGLRNAVYDAIARRRKALFAAPEAACPVGPPALRARFDP